MLKAFTGGPVLKEAACQYRRHGFSPWIGEITWRMKWQPTPVFLPGKPQGQRSWVGYSPWGLERVRHDLATKQRNKWMLKVNKVKIVQMFPDLSWFGLWFFGKSVMYPVDTMLGSFIFSWISGTQRGPLLWCWAVAATAAPRQPCEHKGKQPLGLQPFYTQTAVLFSRSMQ